MASDVCGDKLSSADGGTNIMFWNNWSVPLFQFVSCLEAVPTVESSKKPLGFRTALCPTHCESIAGCSVLELDKETIFPFFTFFFFFSGFFFTVFLRTWASSADLWGY